jgi:1,4-alpha-glucan branching enzyme
MITKRSSRKKGMMRVTFVLPRDLGGKTVHVCGDFNGWQTTDSLKRQKNGEWRVALDLKRGAEYQYRYLVNGGEWVNDPAADKYVPNPYGSENSVVVT